jgi:hypothetical protein
LGDRDGCLPIRRFDHVEAQRFEQANQYRSVRGNVIRHQ